MHRRATTGASVCRDAAVRDVCGDASGYEPALWEDDVELWIGHRQAMANRARRVSTLMLDLWGDAPPPAPDPAMTAAKDALAADDGLGRAAHLVVQGDRLTYRQLGQVLALVQDGDHYAQALSLLPPRLRHRLAEIGHLDERGEDGSTRQAMCEVEDRRPDR